MWQEWTWRLGVLCILPSATIIEVLSMRAIVYTAPLELQLLEVDEPVPGTGEVLIDVRTTGICGSELEGIRSQSPFRVPPLIMGHEFGGERADTGERVVVNPLVACGRCDLCLLGRANVCRDRAVIGVHRSGAFAERVAVPSGSTYPVPADMTWEQAGLVEPFANAVHAWRLVAERIPSRIGIMGAGTIGLVCLVVAQWRGAAEVHVADLAEDRLSVAQKLGATSVSASLEGEFDLIIDAVGASATRRSSVEHLRPGGATVWLGLHSSEPSFDALNLTRSEQTVFGAFGYTDIDFRQAIQLVATVDPFWVTGFPLAQGVDVFMELMHGRTDIIKAQLLPN